MDRITRAVAAITAKYPTRRIYGPLDRPSEYNSLVDELPKKIGYTAQNKAVVLYEYRGVSYTMPELAALSGFSPATLRTRIRSGWSMEDVMNRPLDPLHTSSGSLPVNTSGQQGQVENTTSVNSLSSLGSLITRYTIASMQGGH